MQVMAHVVWAGLSGLLLQQVSGRSLRHIDIQAAKVVRACLNDLQWLPACVKHVGNKTEYNAV